MKARKVSTGRHHTHGFGSVEVVQFVLFFNFLVRTGNHSGGTGQRLLLGRKPSTHVIALLDSGAVQTTGQQPPTLDPPQ